MPALLIIIIVVIVVIVVRNNKRNVLLPPNPNPPSGSGREIKDENEIKSKISGKWSYFNRVGQYDARWATVWFRDGHTYQYVDDEPVNAIADYTITGNTVTFVGRDDHLSGVRIFNAGEQYSTEIHLFTNDTLTFAPPGLNGKRITLNREE